MEKEKRTNIIIDPEEAEREFEREFEKMKKIEELKSSVFKNFTIKKSKSVVHHPAKTFYHSE